MTAEEIKGVVGYHNYYRMSVFDAQQRVQEKCPPGWRAGFSLQYCRHDELPSDVPEGAIRVGQVKVHHGDPAYPLYVYPLKGDRRFKKWAKLLTGVNREKSNGYCSKAGAKDG